jgi:hypothetical protein
MTAGQDPPVLGAHRHLPSRKQGVGFGQVLPRNSHRSSHRDGGDWFGTTEPLRPAVLHIQNNRRLRARPRTDTGGTPPPGWHAQCRYGSYSFSEHHSGTCSGHGGVKQWNSQWNS